MEIMKRLKLIILPAFFLLTVIITSCYYDNAETLYPKLPGPCDTLNVTYNVTVVKLMSTYCYSCHSATYQKDGGGYRLDSYDNVIKYLSKVILGINHDPSTSGMPKNTNQLDDCTINQFMIWSRNPLNN